MQTKQIAQFINQTEFLAICMALPSFKFHLKINIA